MSASKQSLDLIVDNPGYPWQVIEGDGQTLIILRHRMKMDQREVEQLLGVRVEDFTWSCLTGNQEKSLYTGLINLTVYYKGKSFADNKEVFNQAAVETALCRQLFADCSTRCLGMKTPRQCSRQGESIFPHLLLQSPELDGGNQQTLQGHENWEIKAPWLAWLFGKGIEGEPQIVRIHLAQTGLSSLLLEILLSLEAKQEELGNKEYGQGLILTSPRDCLLNLHDDRMEEILGLVEKRELNSCRGESASRELIVESIKKTTLVYVNSCRGGERILTASCTAAESARMPYSPLPKVPPPYHFFASHSPILVRIDEQKALLKTNYSWMVEYPLEPVEVPNPVNKEEIAAVSIYQRKRPLEKWRKPKERSGRAGRTVDWGVLSIKL